QVLARGIDPTLQRQTAKAARQTTFKVVAEEWLSMQAEKLAPITMSKARWILDSFVYPRLGSRPIGAIAAGRATRTPATSQALPAKHLRAIRGMGASRNRSSRSLTSPHTASQLRCATSTAMRESSQRRHSTSFMRPRFGPICRRAHGNGPGGRPNSSTCGRLKIPHL
ncbi:MAG: phage integrase central domain-containing protein, partial [Steroidobacteraceae bacterium]